MAAASLALPAPASARPVSPTGVIVAKAHTGQLTDKVEALGTLRAIESVTLTEGLRRWSLLRPGMLIVPIHGWLTVSERYLAFDEFESGAIYIMPIVLAVIVLPLAILAGRFLNRKPSRSESSAFPSSPTEAQAD